MAQQKLHSVITIGATVDNSLTTLGNTLYNLGSEIDKLSQEIIGFGKEAVTEFIEYDDLMREVQAVGEFTNAEIKALDDLNREIAKTSTYSNKQAAEAEVFLGQLGLTTNEIATVLPSVLEMAMAGNLSLADSANYLYSTLKSLGYELDYAGTLTDQMAKTSAIGATDINTLGDSLTRIGSGLSMFEGGSVEVLAILSAMSDFGEDQRGSQAGTWLRNFMLSLAAPAGSIGEIVEAMEQLGVAQDEIDAYADSHGSGAAALAVNSLAEAGLKIYDDAGNLLPAIDIIKSLRNAVRGSDEYAGDLLQMTAALEESGGDIDAFMARTEGLTDNALYNIFAKIFGKRGITTALNLISVSDEDWDRIFGEILNSDGFGESMVDTMQGGLGGALRSLDASVAELKTTFGELLAPDIQNVAEWLEEIVENISELDDDQMTALTSALGGIAAAGPGMLLAAGAMKFIGYLLTPAGAISAGVVALATLAYYMHQVREADFTENYGTMEVNVQALNDYVDSLSTTFGENQEALSGWDADMTAAAESYEKLSSTFAQNLLTNAITNNVMTDEEKTALTGIGEDMINAVLEGVQLKKGQEMHLLQLIFADADSEEEVDAYTNLINLKGEHFDNLYAEAESIGNTLRAQLTEALRDGKLDGAERQAIQATVDRLNQIEAEIANQLDRGEYYAELSAAERVSWDSIDDFMSQNAEKLESDLEKFHKTWDDYIGATQAQYETKINNAKTSIEKEELAKERDDSIAALKAERDEQEAEVVARRSEVAQRAFDNLMHDSDFSEAWEFLEKVYADQSLRNENGEITVDTLNQKDWSDYFSDGMPEGLGEQLTSLNMADTGPLGWLHGLGTGKLTAALAQYGDDNGITQRMDMLEMSNALGTILTGLEVLATPGMNLGMEHLGQFENPNIMVGMEGDTSEIEKEIDELNGTDISLTPHMDADSAMAQADTDFIGPMPDETYDTTIKMIADASDVDATIAALDGTDIGIDAQADPDDVQRQLNSRPYQISILGRVGMSVGSKTGMAGYADGGRADEASIFGEDGAEWAIPEAHTDRTAELLNAARAASGFTWPDLIGRFGGLNADASHAAPTLVYAPVIHAANAEGVEQKLIEDKKRLDAWWEAKQLKEERVAYE